MADCVRCAICGTRGNHSPGCSVAKYNVEQVKVEILERATTDTFKLTCRNCGRSMQIEQRIVTRQDMTIDECALCEGESDYTRGRRDGMRRARELAAEFLLMKNSPFGEFADAVEKEMNK